MFVVWLAGLNKGERNCFDVYFSQGVGGLNKGSNVSFSGVPVGQVTKISLLPERPEFVLVRLEVDSDTPVLQGTTAQIKGVGFTGVSEIQLDGAVKGAPPITQPGPQGCPVVPASSGGLGGGRWARSSGVKPYPLLTRSMSLPAVSRAAIASTRGRVMSPWV